jgi:hypothetical protein
MALSRFLEHYPSEPGARRTCSLGQASARVREVLALATTYKYGKLPGGKRLTAAEIDSVFWRQLLDVHVPTIGDAYPHYIAANDTMGLLRTWLQIDSIR